MKSIRNRVRKTSSMFNKRKTKSVKNIKKQAQNYDKRKIERSNTDQLIKLSTTLGYTFSKKYPGKIFVKSALATPSKANLLSFSKVKTVPHMFSGSTYDKNILVKNISFHSRVQKNETIKQHTKSNKKKRKKT